MTTTARAAALARLRTTPVDLERRYGARNYDPLKVTLERGEDVCSSTRPVAAIST